MRLLATLSIVVAFLVPGRAQAGAWTLKEDAVQVLSSVTYSTADAAFDSKGRLSQPAAYRKLLTQIHAEFGLRDWLTLIAAPDYASASLLTVTSPSQKADDFSFEAGARVRLSEEYGQFSAQLSAKTAGAFDTNVSANGAPAQQVELRLLYGTGFEFLHRHAFIDTEVGQRWIAGHRADEVPIDVTFGIDLTAREKLLLQSFNVFAEGNAKPPYGYYRVHKFSLSGVRRLWNGISIESAGYLVVAGQNALAERGYFLRVWVEL